MFKINLKKIKQIQIEKIKKDCTANDPHTLLVTLANADEINITFNGGDSSAIAIKAGYDFFKSKIPEVNTMKVWDINNETYVVSLEVALDISKKIGEKYYNEKIKRQELITEINSATTKEEVELIVW